MRLSSSSMLAIAFAALLCVASVRAGAVDPVGPASYCIQFDTDESGGRALPVLLQITRSWAPLGSDRLYALMKAGFFDRAPAAFFRVVPGFVVQFGISGLPALNAQWGNLSIPDDPVTQSNLNGTLTFATAGPNTRTTQLFINTANNAGLDSQGFAPLGQVVQGMGTVLALFNPTPGSSDGVDQAAYSANGAAWIDKTYPGINSIVKAQILPMATCPL